MICGPLSGGRNRAAPNRPADPLRRRVGKARREPRRRRLAWAAAAAAVVLTIGGAAAWNLLHTTEPPLEPMRTVPLTSYPGYEGAASFSPDGNQVAFAWTGGDTGEFRHLHQTYRARAPVATYHPSRLGQYPRLVAGRPPHRFSPRTYRGRKKMGLYLIPALGGTERKLAETRVPFTYLLGTCLAWSPGQPLAGRVAIGRRIRPGR